MPAFMKYRHGSATKLDNHNARRGRQNNPEIRPQDSLLNYKLCPDRPKSINITGDRRIRMTFQTGRDYYRERLNEVFRLQRKDVNTFCGLIVTAPKGVVWRDGEMEQFFKVSYEFIKNFEAVEGVPIGGQSEENIISAYVHMDETQPHLQTYFLPIVPNPSGRGGKFEKISAKTVIHKGTLFKFHREFKEFLQSQGMSHIAKAIYMGITKAQGGNRTVKGMKQARSNQRQKMHNKGVYLR